MARDDATQRQIDAAQPDRSTWLSANAGSGKTRVLTDRVARLLLNGVNPQHILCLTYTKAAASEMQNRLFARLGEWAMLADQKLTDELQQLGFDGPIRAQTLGEARRLFAQAIEAPGGLKIQTIHSFCSSLLRRFPLESGVSPQFTEMEERTADLLRNEIVEDLASGADADLLYDVARHFSGESLQDLTAEIVRHRTAFGARLDDVDLSALFGKSAGLTFDQITSQVFLGNELDILKALIPVLLASGTNDQKAGLKLSQITDLDTSALPVLENVFLTGSSAKYPFSAKIGSFPTKACQKNITDILPQLEQWMQRIEDTRESRLALGAMQKTRALHKFANAFLPAYDTAKQIRGLLDFDDLILRARNLLTNADVAAWVLFRLDGGIDHILVDEAQDTSPVQWQVIEQLAQEFTSGQGARVDAPRTIFVVGDKKQSIYSFQGADPREFDRMKREFAQRLQATGNPLQAMEMEYSFRSSHAILTLVDHTFANSQNSGFTPEQGHKAFKSELPGRVDLWPVIEPPEKEDGPDWHNPVDLKAANDPAILLARKVAREIRRMIDRQQAIPDEKARSGFRAVRPGDFLILVQRRSDLFHEIIRECKAQALPIAGADRLKVGAELAVKDLAALLSFLATPEDSLSLAVALRSPLFGWSEADLYDLAQGRTQRYLWAELRDQAANFPETMEVLDDLRNQTDYLRPYDLIERILTRHDGRRKLLARLGAEAEDGIDALLSQAMAYEQRTVDSLTGFLVWMETDDLEIKRQMDSAGNRIRVMTVHGAKGLEAPVVILPDTGRRNLVIRDQIVIRDNTALWRSSADSAPSRMTEATEAAKTAQKAERDRLLYVAMTRAEKWLIVAASGDLGNAGDTWYEKIARGMDQAGATLTDTPDGPVMRLEHGIWAETETITDLTPTADALNLEPLFYRPAPAIEATSSTFSPSDLGGAKALPGERGLDEEAAKRRGRQIHRLLEFLPQVSTDRWPHIAAHLLANGPDAAAGDELSLLLAEAQKVLTRPSLASLFHPDALTEVSVTANLDALGGHRIHGTIDRLLIDKARVLAVDFKTNAMVPDTPNDCPDGLLRQMGAYAHALQMIYPDHKIETALLWTRTATLMPLPHDLVTDALRTTQIS
ncbi:ATP-dependent helicase/nuclease subunit A [Roseovarius litorisediminis]|uniref:DNA 3'-5' helicase n=1 Tax=Roseovarius litorisediminis TaxID=1312363 RepID=A0A1Y5SS08_9RHOB|nr:double-strand break repair helicase AddA [Roseovarius litorisediminis]SLN43824.1 ATP-dependent helicase/nuclease subunit A [Roseovarius litorisediminis]